MQSTVLLLYLCTGINIMVLYRTVTQTEKQIPNNKSTIQKVMPHQNLIWVLQRLLLLLTLYKGWYRTSTSNFVVR